MASVKECLVALSFYINKSLSKIYDPPNDILTFIFQNLLHVLICFRFLEGLQLRVDYIRLSPL